MSEEEDPQHTLAEGTSSSSDPSKASSSPTSAAPESPAPILALLADGKATYTPTAVVMFKNTGNAPPLKQKIFKLNATSPWKTVQTFLRKQLKYEQSDPLFLFVNSTFQPSPDEIVADLFKCFHNNGKLIVNYATTVAWG